MILTTHAIVGAAIVNMIPNHPVLGFSLALGSHYILDLIPHKDYLEDFSINENLKTIKSLFLDMEMRLSLLSVFVDFIASVAICFLIFVRGGESLLLTALGVLAGILPDFLQFLYFKFKSEPWILTQKIHDSFHAENKMKNIVFLGYSLQILFAIFFISSFYYLG